jgi:protein-disulfide isomerase
VSSKLRLSLAAVMVVIIVAVGGFYFFVNRAGTSAIDQAVAPAAGAPADKAAALMVPGPFGERALGDPKAPNVMIEYGSLTCPHCMRFMTTVFNDFKAKYIDTGKVYYLFRTFSLNDLDTAAIMLTYCVPPDRFFPLVQLLYQHQGDWTNANPVAALQKLVKQAGMGEDEFNACLKNQTVLDGVTQIRDHAGKDFGVDSTPTFFINGKAYAGEQSLEDLDKILGG